jgi:RNA recognition motif-containing protein
MAAKLFVGNLAFDVLENDVHDLFAQAGTVISVNILQDRFTGQGRGFGFVEMSSDAEAKKAIEMLDGKDFQGRDLKVNEARPREPRPGEGAGKNRGGGKDRSGGGSGYRGQR